MNSENIKAVFTDYLVKEKTQYAILLNGTWGSGKTYFWKNELTKIVEEKQFKPIYVSLNGVSKIEALEHLMFLKLVPFIGNQENKTLKSATTIITNIANLLGRNLIKTTISDIFKDLSVDTFNFSKYVICFDDLERCQIPIKEILGFINNYVEHKNLKTIIFSDEKNIDPTQKGYDNIKEKVIGRIINFEPSVEDILPILFQKFEKSNSDFYEFLKLNKEYFTELLKEYKQENLRTISFYLDILEKLYPSFKNIDSKYKEEIMLFSALITIEFKKGNLKSSDSDNSKGLEDINQYIYSFTSAQLESALFSNGKKKERVKSYSEIFYDIYLKKSKKNYFFYKSIYTFILSGFINIENFENEIKIRYPEIISIEIKCFRELINYEFRILTDETFNELCKNVLKFAKEGKYSLYDYVQLAKFFYFFSENDLIVESKADVKSYLLNGLNISKEKKEINDNELDYLFRFGDDNPDITEMKEKVKAIHFEIKKETYFDISNEIINSFKNNDEKTLVFIFKENPLSKNIFQYLDGKKFFDSVVETSNKQMFKFIKILEKRYNSANIGEFLYEDYNYLNTLRLELQQYIKAHSKLEKLRKFLITSLIETLTFVCERLDKTKK